LILGVSEDKDVPGILEELLPGISQVVVTRSFHPRAMDPGQLAKLVEERGTPARVVEKVEDALVDALQQAGPDTVVLAAGSLFIAAAVRESWRQNSGLKKE
jgi:dihydrofolate synthase/folylpolyglutamate synthase